MFLDHVKFSSNALSSQSPLRMHNEDAFLHLPEHRFFAVADGMGGHKGGEIASSIATLHLKTWMEGRPEIRQTFDVLSAQLSDEILMSNKHIWHAALAKPALEGMGTTLCTLWLDGRFAIHAHIGDSRLYRLRGDELGQLTSDHTAYREALTQKNATTTTQHVLTRALGCTPTITPSIGYQVAFPKDRFLLCTDGATDVVSKDQLKNSLAITDRQNALQHLISAARSSGSTDDITLILVDIEYPDVV